MFFHYLGAVSLKLNEVWKCYRVHKTNIFLNISSIIMCLGLRRVEKINGILFERNWRTLEDAGFGLEFTQELMHKTWGNTQFLFFFISWSSLFLLIRVDMICTFSKMSSTISNKFCHFQSSTVSLLILIKCIWELLKDIMIFCYALGCISKRR